MGGMTPGGLAKSATKQDEACKELMAKLELRTQQGDFMDEATRLINESTEYDRVGLQNFLDKLAAEQTSQKSGVTDTISINKAKDLGSGGTKAAPGDIVSA